MNCAKCNMELKKEFIEGIELDVCPKCSGIWFDFNELSEILDKPFQKSLKNHKNNNQDHDLKRASCPKCGVAGKMINVIDLKKNTHLDSCIICNGIWLDGGEYEILKKEGFLIKIKNIFRNVFY